MHIRNRTHATITRWTEYRTPSGRWSKVKHGIEELYFDAAQLRRFFSTRFQRAADHPRSLPGRVLALPCDSAVPGWDDALRVQVQLLE